MFSTLMYGWIQSMSFSLNIVWNVGTSISQTGSGPRSDSCSCWSYQDDMRRGEDAPRNKADRSCKGWSWLCCPCFAGKLSFQGKYVSFYSLASCLLLACCSSTQAAKCKVQLNCFTHSRAHTGMHTDGATRYVLSACRRHHFFQPNCCFSFCCPLRVFFLVLIGPDPCSRCTILTRVTYVDILASRKKQYSIESIFVQVTILDCVGGNQRAGAYYI